MDIPGGVKMIQEYYRQMRKFGCNILAVVQQYDVIKDSPVRGAMIGNSKMFLTVGFHRCPVWARPIQRGLFSGFCNPIRGYGSAKSEGFPTGTTGFVYTYFLLFPLRYQCWSIRQIPVSIPPRPTKVIDRSNFLSFIQVPTRRSRSLPPLTRRLLLREIFSSATKSMRPTARPELFW